MEIRIPCSYGIGDIGHRPDYDVHDHRWIPGSYHDAKHDRTDHNGASGSEAAEGMLQYSGQVLLSGQRGQKSQKGR